MIGGGGGENASDGRKRKARRLAKKTRQQQIESPMAAARATSVRSDARALICFKTCSRRALQVATASAAVLSAHLNFQSAKQAPDSRAE